MGKLKASLANLDTMKDCVHRLMDYCERNKWAGFDPYDALNSRILNATPFMKSRIFRIAITQFLKRLPINVRPLLMITQEENPKAIALFLMAFLKLKKQDLLAKEDLLQQMIQKLKDLRSPEVRYWCWGYSFPWQTRTIMVPRWAPNLVSTSFSANALLDAYEDIGEPECLSMALSAGEYILSRLYWTEGDEVASFSYPIPGVKSCVHNANFLAAALLCRLARYSGERRFKDIGLRVARYSASQQRNDGSWDYGEQVTQRWVDNFHTGYNLCALRAIGLYGETQEFDTPLARGFVFYRSHFFTNEGATKYFHNNLYPIDIHSVAQSLITLVTLRDLDQSAMAMADTVWNWALTHMWDRQGYFYYRIHRFGRVKISYMRWAQAWMVLALATLISQRNCHTGLEIAVHDRADR